MTLFDAAPVTDAAGDLDHAGVFYAPAPHGLIDGLLGQYQAMRQRVEQVSALITGELEGAVGYFLQGNLDRNRYTPAVAELFAQDGAIAALNSDFWSRTLALTDVYQCMPQARKDEWDNQIRERTTPDYTPETVAATIEDLLNARERFFAERVDGLFRNLSGDHVTNVPQGFAKRMILGWMFCEFGTVNHSRSGYVHDLRDVIARFMGRDAPQWNATPDMLRICRKNPGQWHSVDGGALRVRVYKKGTVHIEVHPDMAARLNSVLAFLHPHAIPASFRVKPVKPSKEFAPLARPLPFAVLAALGNMRTKGSTAWLPYVTREDKVTTAEIVGVLESIGGVATAPGVYEFDYPVQDVLDFILTNGTIPDDKSHQFYPTPPEIALRVIELASIGPTDRCLEPSAGDGAIATLMPADRTQCVELSALRCKILTGKGLEVTQGDFIEWAKDAPQFDRILLNPPFSEGRAITHLRSAAGLLARGGRIVAVLPASLRGKQPVAGLHGTWSDTFANAFAGTNAAVCIYTATRAP